MTRTGAVATATDGGWWGLLGPRTVVGERRARSLGLAAAVRRFNDLAVPGLGGVWFAKPLLLATLGVAIATQTKRRNIEVANTVEALACWLALKGAGRRADPRLRGRLKLRADKPPLYALARRPNFYVSQPMRQQTVQPLMALGFVEAAGERFNSFRVSEVGRALLDQGLEGFRPHRQSVERFLEQWVAGSERTLDRPELTAALSPLEALPPPCRVLIRGRVAEGGGVDAGRRRAALEWVSALGHGSRVEWEARPTRIDEQHWLDLRCGGRFFVMRDAALAVLDETEKVLASLQAPSLSLHIPLPEPIRDAIAVLKENADSFLQMDHDPSPASLARGFAHHCRGADDAQVLAWIVQREGRGLRLGDGAVLPGPAFRGRPRSVADAAEEAEADDSEVSDDAEEAIGSAGPAWPPGISRRMKNLFTLHQDLEGGLDFWLKPATEER